MAYAGSRPADTQQQSWMDWWTKNLALDPDVASAMQEEEQDRSAKDAFARCSNLLLFVVPACPAQDI